MARLQGDEGVDHGRLGKVLELERRIARRVAGQDPLAVDRLVVLLEHDGGMLGAGDAKAVAPGHRQVEQRGVPRHLVGKGLVHRWHPHVGQGQRDGQMLEEHEGTSGAQQPQSQSWLRGQQDAFATPATIAARPKATSMARLRKNITL